MSPIARADTERTAGGLAATRTIIVFGVQNGVKQRLDDDIIRHQLPLIL